jgi:hypothetical protein
MQMRTLLLTMAMLVVGFSACAETYTWVDDQGTMNFADDLSSVPQKYRKKAHRSGGDEPTAVESPAPQSLSVQPAAAPGVKKEQAESRQEKKETAFGGKSETVWRQEIGQAKAELKSV